jgi:Holliday junction resolvase RusA-like endonuclease
LTPLSLPYPPTLNNLFANVPGKGRVKSNTYRRWLAEALALLRAQRAPKVLGSYHLRILAYRPDRRARDLDNLAKTTSDVLKLAGVIEDDSLAKTISMAWSDDEPKAPGAITVWVEAA